MSESPSRENIASWFSGRLPEEWFTAAPQITVDRDEILVVGTLAAPEPAGEKAAEGDKEAAAGRVARFREDTRERRMAIAREAEERFDRKVAWGAEGGGQTELFTTMSVPVMTRLRQPERRVLDTLVDAGVARSRSHALAWCVRLVGEKQAEWIENPRNALVAVEKARSEGPSTG